MSLLFMKSDFVIRHDQFTSKLLQSRIEVIEVGPLFLYKKPHYWKESLVEFEYFEVIYPLLLVLLLEWEIIKNSNLFTKI